MSLGPHSFEERLAWAHESSQNSQQICSQYQKEAKRTLLSCKEYGGSLREAEEHLLALQVIFLDQLDLSAGLYGEAKRNMATLNTYTTSKTHRRRQIDRKLASVYQKLKEQTIDSAFAKALPPNATLFHFVDTDSVSSLQAQLDGYLTPLQEKRNAAQTSLSELDSRLNELQELVSLFLKDNTFLSGLLDTPKEPTKAQDSEASSSNGRLVDHFLHSTESDLSAITSILVSVSSLADRVSATRSRFIRTREDDLLEFQLEALEGSVRQLPNSLAKASECLSRIKERAECLAKQCTQSHGPFARCGQIKALLLDMEGSLASSIQSMNQYTQVSFSKGSNWNLTTKSSRVRNLTVSWTFTLQSSRTW